MSNINKRYAVQDDYGYYLTFTNRANQGGKNPVDGDTFFTVEAAQEAIKTHGEGQVVDITEEFWAHVSKKTPANFGTDEQDMTPDRNAHDRVN